MNDEPVSINSIEEIETAVDEVWPAPSFRMHQRETIVEVLEKLYIDGYDAVTLNAPTGTGKSLIIYTVGKALSYLSEKKTFSTTPLNSLIDQIQDDDFINDVVTLKGKNNYDCVHIMDRGTSVDDAICQRNASFNCEFKSDNPSSGGCPYYGQKKLAKQSDVAVTNLSYLMANSMIPEEQDARFHPRELLAIDEVQNIDSFGIQFIGFTVSEKSVPVNFDAIDGIPKDGSSMDEMIDWLQQLLDIVVSKHTQLAAKEELTTLENKDRQKLERFYHRLTNFLGDYNEGYHWTKTHKEEYKVQFKPIKIGRFIDKFLWEQANKYLLSSATIPKGGFLEEIGLDEHSVAEVKVPSTFPADRRPVITTEMVGKMTKSERDSTIPEMADKIEDIAEFHEGEKGFIHCNSYTIARRLYEQLSPKMRARATVQDQDEREESLEEWKHSYTQIFFSVAMAEGISLDDDAARWQVVAKASFPFLGDKRVSYRVNELSDWDWYNQQAVTSVIQAVGRGMRSPDDWCVTYLLDESFDSLLRQNTNLFHDWFLQSIDVPTDLDVYESPSKFSFSS